MGVKLSNNPLIFELCDGTHALTSAAHSFDANQYPEPVKMIHIYHDRLHENVPVADDSVIYLRDDIDFFLDV